MSGNDNVLSEKKCNEAKTDDQKKEELNLWPYITNYFKLDSCKGERLCFQCQKCLPTKKILTCTEKSRSGLKSHIDHVHPFCSSTYKACIDKGSKMQASRKRLLVPKVENQIDAKCIKSKMLVQSTMLDAGKSGKYSQTVIDNKIAAFVVEDMQSLSVVESKAFNEILNLIPGHQKNPMTRRKITKRIEDNFELQKEVLKNKLSSLSCVATTADAWSCRNRSYLGMTVHWIDPKTLKRTKSVLSCQRLVGKHTYDTLAKAIQDVHFSFGIASNVISTTTDNGSNFVKAFKIVGATTDGDLSAMPVFEAEEASEVDQVEVSDLTAILASEEDALYDLPKHWRCAAHTLNLVATSDAEKAFSDISYKKANRSAFGKAVSLWNKQSRSSQASDTIRQHVGRLLVVPNATRWNSVYDAVVNLLRAYDQNKSGFQNACRVLETRCFTANDLTFLAEYKEVMGPIAAGLDMLQGEDKAYMGLLLPTLGSILHSLKTKEQSNCLMYCNSLIECMLFGLEKRFNVFFTAKECILASATHPNYRLSRWLEWLPGVCAEEVRQTVISNISSIMESDEAEENCDVRTDDSAGSGEHHLFQELYDSYSKRDVDIKEIVSKFVNDQPSRSSCIQDDAFPNKSLHNLFIKYNTSIPSSAAVERMFSLGKDIMRPKRSRLSDEHFEMLVFLQGNKLLM